MINDHGLAVEISRILLEVSGRIDETIAIVHQQSSELESQEYCRAAGAIMGAILTEILNPIFKSHPEIAPLELQSFYIHPNK
ncbi:hypothetical protein [Pseudomonas sp. BMS12]|uniref:hypothetical protein n=1 Tax=Pseudomonas sp. BMS12 TaxID=1796033 RepID=UPI001290682C|nr:hypothetical protein [Pseudomonas sp. BMS12]